MAFKTKKNFNRMLKGNLSQNQLDFFAKPLPKKETSLKLDTPVEEVIIRLQKLQSKEDFLKFCYINRFHLSFDLLYRLTILKLRNENNQENSAKIFKIEEFRKKIMKNTLITDQAIAQSLILGEKRIKEILNKSHDPEIVEKKIGEDRVNVSCFWVVLFASLVAWEKKNSIEGQLESIETYQKLLNIKKIFEKSDRHQNLLANELKVIQKQLLQEGKKEILEIDVESMRGLKLLVTQLEKLPSGSYGPLLESVIEIYKTNFFKIFGMETGSLQKQYTPFVPVKIKTMSKLIKIQQKN
mmetsp:Transcript_529/g.1243  ORF Transcript_529/g.1243 Transcript_529/m.1243 type:complete len:297 (-) Transcript_529:2345-3235(-)